MASENKYFLKRLLKGVRIFVNRPKDSVFQRWYFRHSHRLLKFKNFHKNESCFILGNGPSLKNMDLIHLKNYNTFGLNKIYLMFNEIDLNLSYHVAVNPLVIEQSGKEFENLQCPSFLSYRASRNKVKEIEHLYFIMTGGPYTFQTNIEDEICEGHTVTYVAMQIAYYMGFKEVFLIGVDHSFSVRGEPNEKHVLSGADWNHFHQEYFKGKEWNLPDLEASELSYYLASFFYNRSGRRIYDATVDGRLNIFPKITFEEALKRCTRKQ